MYCAVDGVRSWKNSEVLLLLCRIKSVKQDEVCHGACRRGGSVLLNASISVVFALVCVKFLHCSILPLARKSKHDMISRQEDIYLIKLNDSLPLSTKFLTGQLDKA